MKLLLILLSLSLMVSAAFAAPAAPPVTDDLLEEMADPTESEVSNTIYEPEPPPPESVGAEDSAEVIEGEAQADSKPDEFENETSAVSNEVEAPSDMPDFFAELEKIPHIDIEKFRTWIFATIGGLAFLVLAFTIYFFVVPKSRKKRIAGDLLLSVVSLAVSAAAAFATFFWNFTSLHAPDAFASLVLAAKYAGGVFVGSLVLIHFIAFFVFRAMESSKD